MAADRYVTGNHNPRVVYQVQPDGSELMVGALDTRALAAMFVDAVNASAANRDPDELGRAFEAGRRAGRQEAAQQVLVAADELLEQAHKASGHGLYEFASALCKSVLQWRALADVISPGSGAARIAEGEPDGQP